MNIAHELKIIYIERVKNFNDLGITNRIVYNLVSKITDGFEYKVEQHGSVDIGDLNGTVLEYNEALAITNEKLAIDLPALQKFSEDQLAQMVIPVERA